MKQRVMKTVESEAEFDKALQDAADQLVVVDFFATWCPPCKMLSPLLEEMAARHPGCVFIKVDVDQCQELGQKYEISAMPTIKFIKAGEVVDSVRGADVEAIEAMIEKHGTAGGVSAFSGEGQHLTSTTLDTSALPSAVPVPEVQLLPVSESKVTTLRISLLNGQTIALKMNHCNTVAQLYRAVDQCFAAQGLVGGQNYGLSFGMPAVSIDPSDQNLKDAGLVGWAMTQHPLAAPVVSAPPISAPPVEGAELYEEGEDADIAAAIAASLGGTSGAAAAGGADHSEAIDQVVAMGFSREQAAFAVDAAAGDVSAALNMLM